MSSGANVVAFAAPAAASDAAANGLVGASQVSLALLLVIGAIFGLAWVLRRLKVLPAAAPGAIEVLSQVALGARERAVLLRVGRERVLVGISAGGVQPLLVLAAEPVAESGTSPPIAPVVASTEPSGFADLLRRSLGR